MERRYHGAGVRVIAIVAAAGLIGASACLNVLAALAKGGSPLEQAAWIATAISADLIKCTAPLAMVAAATVAPRIVAAALLSLTLAFSTVNALHYSSAQSEQRLAAAAQTEAQRARLLAAHERLVRVAETSQRKADRNEAEARAVALRKELDRLPSITTGTASPAATAVASYANALGARVEPGSAARWLAALPVLLLELGSAFALLMSAGLKHRETPAARAPEQARTNPTPGPVDPDNAAVLTRLETLAQGGRVRGSQRGLARLIGTSPATLNRALAALATTGALTYAASRMTGTEIILADAVRVAVVGAV